MLRNTAMTQKYGIRLVDRPDRDTCKMLQIINLRWIARSFDQMLWLSGSLVMLLLWPPATAAAQTDVVATVEGQAISSEKLRSAMRAELLQLDLERYQAMRTRLDAVITAHLYDLEAEKRGISRAELERSEILTKIEPVGPDKVRSFYEKNSKRLAQPFEVLKGRLTELLKRQAELVRREAFARELRERYEVRIHLKPPRAEVGADDDPFMGAADAPVTLIEFSDFQCPYCRRVQPVLKRLLSTYEGKLRVVYRDFPLRGIHPEAQKAAEAAQCANEQGKFWSYHDRLFEATSLGAEHLKQYAAELGLDVGLFSSCLESGRFYQEVQDDVDDAVAAGVNAAPAFFVNGLMINGAVPYERFVELVELALEETQSP